MTCCGPAWPDAKRRRFEVRANAASLFVMAGLVPAIHVFVPLEESKTWITATSAVMTFFVRRQAVLLRRQRSSQ
jgi:hypothetical protein